MSQNKLQVRVGVAAIVYNDKGEILMAKRKSAHANGLWGFIGGHLEMGESPQDCAVRETMEEAGIEIGNIRMVGMTNDIFAEDKHYISIFVEADHVGGTVTNCEPDKFEEWQWCSWNDLPEPLFSPISNLLAGPFRDRLRIAEKKQAA